MITYNNIYKILFGLLLGAMFNWKLTKRKLPEILYLNLLQAQLWCQSKFYPQTN